MISDECYHKKGALAGSTDAKLCFPSQNLTKAIQNGVYPVGNESKIEDTNWDFSNSFFFAGTVVSTIGRYNAFHRCVGLVLLVSGC